VRVFVWFQFFRLVRMLMLMFVDVVVVVVVVMFMVVDVVVIVSVLDPIVGVLMAMRMNVFAFHRIPLPSAS
jgi:hypothetical protein